MASSGKRKRNDNEDANDLTIDGINTISVKTCTGKTFSLQVKGSDTIISVKFKISDKIFIPHDEQALIFNDMVLEDNIVTLADYRVKKDSTLTLMRKSSGLVPILINYLNRKMRCTVNVKLSDTVCDLKDKIRDITYPHDDKELVIVFNDIVLDDCCILADLHITVDSVVTLMHKSKPRTMEIFVKILTGKTISLEVITTNTIGQVKTAIMYQEHIPDDEQVLIFNEMVLDDSSIMFDFGIKKGSTLTLMRVSKELMQIFVNTVNGRSTSFEVKPLDTIGNLKNQISYRIGGYPIEKQVLIFNEMVLHDSGTLADFHIKRESTLTLMRKSMGLMQIFVQSCERKISLEVNPLYTIADLKARLLDKGFSPEMRLVFNGRRLQDDRTYADYNILKDDFEPPHSLIHDVLI
ncbi:ubiquitin [Artemisia annua]|uniref:Ubiquitin n=1 Tax=Artemisia annua TaxID=35608 RepID=A0A2U1PYA9_ARTAN|nr:ubiquitin [Artemisia annua]